MRKQKNVQLKRGQTTVYTGSKLCQDYLDQIFYASKLWKIYVQLLELRLNVGEGHQGLAQQSLQ